jgi:hypothetical protein
MLLGAAADTWWPAPPPPRAACDEEEAAEGALLLLTMEDPRPDEDPSEDPEQCVLAGRSSISMRVSVRLGHLGKANAPVKKQIQNQH